MSITKSKSYTTTDGSVHATLELAQRAELERLLTERIGSPPASAQSIATVIVEMREEFIAILCASGRKPRTVKSKGNGVKKRRVLKPDAQGVVDMEKAGGDK